MKAQEVYSLEEVSAIFDLCIKIADWYDVPCAPRTEAEQTAHEIRSAIKRAQEKFLQEHEGGKNENA